MSSKEIIGFLFFEQSSLSNAMLLFLEQFILTLQATKQFIVHARWGRSNRAPAVNAFLEQGYGNSDIDLNNPTFTASSIDWLPFSTDHSPCDCFLCNILINTVFRNNPEILDELEEFMCAACTSDVVDTLQTWLKISFFVCDIFVLQKIHILSRL